MAEKMVDWTVQRMVVILVVTLVGDWDVWKADQLVGEMALS